MTYCDYGTAHRSGRFAGKGSGRSDRPDAAGVVGASERHARRIVSALMEHGVLAADSARAPLRLVFPAALASRWMPGLFPEKLGEDVK